MVKFRNSELNLNLDYFSKAGFSRLDLKNKFYVLLLFSVQYNIAFFYSTLIQ